MSTSRRLAVLALVSLCLVGCQRREKTKAPPQLKPLILLEGLRLIDQTPPEHRPVAVGSAAMRNIFVQALENADIVTTRPEAGRNQAWDKWMQRARARNKPIDQLLWKANLEIGMIYGIQTEQGMAKITDTGLVKVIARGDVSIRQPGQTERFHVIIDLTQESPFEPKQHVLQATYRGHLTVIARQLADRINGTIQVYAKPKSELIATVKSTDRDARLAAIQRLAELRDKDAVPTLIEQLSKEADRAIKHRLIGALAEIGDRRAAPALIGLADTRDRDMLHSVLEALGVIGGPRVIDFFDILSMHDARSIREMVEAARTRLKRRNGDMVHSSFEHIRKE
ncbi:MAG: HEAT repeat domain-containing protein [Myxococcota bacterium]|nr:HEAT repeat domain-containing protein [Myxococcota bacterium]